MAKHESARRQWQRHWLINRRADWLALVKRDRSLGGPAKGLAYALAVEFDEKTMEVQATRERLGEISGQAPKSVSAGWKALEEAGYIAVSDKGSHANIYSALRLDEIETDSRRNPENGIRTDVHMVPKTGSESAGLSSQNRPSVIPKTAASDPENGHLSSRFREPLYNSDQDSEGSALQRALPSRDSLPLDSCLSRAPQARPEGACGVRVDDLAIGPDPDRFEPIFDDASDASESDVEDESDLVEFDDETIPF